MIYAKTYNCSKEPWLLKNKPEKAVKNNEEINDIYASDKILLQTNIDNLVNKYSTLEINEYSNGQSEELVDICLNALKNNENILMKNCYLKNRENDYFIKYDYLLKQDNKYTIFIILYKSLENAIKDYSSKASLIPKYLYCKDILKSNIDSNSEIKIMAVDLVDKDFVIEEINDEMFSSNDLNKTLYSELYNAESTCQVSRKCKKCQYRDYCGIPKFSVADLESTPNCWRVLDPIIKANNSLDLDLLTEEQINTLKPYQLARYKAYKSENGIYYDEEIIKSFLDTISTRGYISFDFETYSSLIAFNEQYENYSQIPFSYSYDLVDKNGNVIEHKIFVVDYKDENFESLIKELVQTLPIDLPIVVYYKSFETTRLKELQKLHPEVENILQSYIDNIIDLYEVFSKGGYYDMKFNNSISLKSVYPNLCQSNDYENLEINHGDDCAIQYKELFNTKKEDGADVLINSIKDYNSKDTMAQVEIIEKLKNIIKY